MMVIDNQFNHGDTVFLKTDIEQLPRIVYGLQVYPSGSILYGLCSGEHTSWHYGIEISTEKNELIKCT